MMTSRLMMPQVALNARWLTALRAPLLALSCLAALTSAPGVSSAQTGGTIADPLQALSSMSLTLSPSDEILNIDTCAAVAEETEFTLSGEYAGVAPYTLRLVATTQGTCTNDDSCNEVPLDDGQCSCLRSDPESPETITRKFRIRDLFDEPCVQGEERVVSFFLHYRKEAQEFQSEESDESDVVKLDIDLKAPSDPSEPPAVLPAEEALKITVVDVGGDASRYSACVREAGSGADFERCKTVSADEQYRFEDLQNEVTYEVIYYAYDAAGNKSEASPVAQGTPASVLDFAEVYSQQYPGGELGGCESTSGARSASGLLALLLSLFGARRLRRRQLTLVTSCAALSLTLFSPLLHAEPWVTTDSDRTTTVTFQAGSYMPSIDSEFQERPNTPRPYELIFQNDAPLMFVVQADRHLYRRYGTLSVGGSFGYWSVEGQALSQDPEVKESTEMSVYPLVASVNYRFDTYQEVIPLVPIVKLGFNYYLWTVYDGSGEPARFVDGSEASGATFGFSYTLGVHFLLDALDREMAWAFNRDAGVNHSYVSLEYQSSQVDDFGSTSSFRLGSDVFFVGLALDI